MSKSPPRVGLGFSVARLAWDSARTLGGATRMTWRNLIMMWLGHATPAAPHHTPLKLAFGLGCPILHVSHHASTHALPYPRSKYMRCENLKFSIKHSFRFD
ncbi:hypothetical protein Hanom_Chr16g01512411 [Helianthus anomalus]